MPRISEFYGIVIAMFYNDHEPPHFHAIYGEYRALVAVEPARVLNGELPRRATNLVLEWARMHNTELMNNWQRAREHQALLQVPPLD